LIGICSPGQFVGSVRVLFTHHAQLWWNTHYETESSTAACAIDGSFIRHRPCLEELHQLLARAVIVPLASRFDDFEQLVGRFSAVALGVERGRQVESRLMVERVFGDFLFQLGHRTDRLGLLGEFDRGLHRLDGASLRFDSGTIASVCLACSTAPVVT